MKKIAAVLLSAVVSISFPTTAFAHSGRTDGSGGHHDYNNKSGLGSYHYHCGGFPAHLHPNGVCPYASSSAGSSSSGSSSSTSEQTAQGTWKKNENGKWTYLVNGQCQIGWVWDGSDWYYTDENGEMFADVWLEDTEHNLYYFYSWGGLATGWYKVNGDWFYSDEDGIMASSKWIEDKGEWYYIKSNGVMAKGWLDLNGKWYYMNSNGVMQTGWQNIGGETYYMSTSAGYCATEWSKIGGKIYYFDPFSCALVRDSIIDGRYLVDGAGIFIADLG